MSTNHNSRTIRLRKAFTVRKVVTLPVNVIIQSSTQFKTFFASELTSLTSNQFAFCVSKILPSPTTPPFYSKLGNILNLIIYPNRPFSSPLSPKRRAMSKDQPCGENLKLSKPCYISQSYFGKSKGTSSHLSSRSRSSQVAILYPT